MVQSRTFIFLDTSSQLPVKYLYIIYTKIYSLYCNANRHEKNKGEMLCTMQENGLFVNINSDSIIHH